MFSWWLKHANLALNKPNEPPLATIFRTARPFSNPFSTKFSYKMSMRMNKLSEIYRVIVNLCVCFINFLERSNPF